MKPDRTDHIALIPAYRPDERMVNIIRELAGEGFMIVAVDDGSGPEYGDLFRLAAEHAVILTHDVNKGKGAALKTGLAYIDSHMISSDREKTVVVTVDADGQHLARDAAMIAGCAASAAGTLVLGSRALREDVPLRSRMGNDLTRHVFRLATGVRVHDTQTGLRAFTGGLIPYLLEIEGSRYEYEMNMLLGCARSGIPIKEEEIKTVYIDGNSGSHFDTLKDSYRIYREIIRFSASSLISFIIDYSLYALLLVLTAHIASSGSTGAAAICTAYGLVISNIGARLVSSSVNYTINRKFVFGSRAGIARSAAGYFALAAFILAGNTIVLKTLIMTLGMNSLAAKLATELIFFCISWLVQKYVIFSASYENENETAGSARLRGRRPGKLKSACFSTGTGGRRRAG